MHEMGMQARCLFDCYRLERAIDHEIAKALAPIRQRPIDMPATLEKVWRRIP